MTSRLIRLMKIGVLLLGAVLITFLGLRIFDTQRGPPLAPWHSYIPQELSAHALDRTDWAGYLAHEKQIFEQLRQAVTQRLPSSYRVPFNRYYEDSPVYPGRFVKDFNRSYILEPDGKPRGVVVLLHGLTDAPYSLRHVADFYRARGFVAIVPRMPAHGTVPSALTVARWELWTAATRLAVREAKRRSESGAPLHLVGYSNGGALALIHALDALGDPSLGRPDRIVLLSPMVGITPFARFAGLAGLPAFLPAFAKAAWLDIVPEFNPFKYNSFPVNGARQSHRLTRVLQERMTQYSREGRLDRLPPVLTFQSAVDFTVSASAVVKGLYEQLPANGSELVLFDINRTLKIGPLLHASADGALTRLLPAPPHTYRITTIANADETRADMIERSIDAGETDVRIRPLAWRYPEGFYSLSHIALPFPVTDGLYGTMPDPAENFGVRLGTLAPRGERNVLITSLDSLMRASSNPFFPYILERIGEGLREGPTTLSGVRTVDADASATP